MLLEMSNELVEIVPGRVWSFDDGSPLLMDLKGNQKVVNPRKIEIYPDAFTGTVCWYLRDLPDEVLSGVIRHFGGDPFLLRCGSGLPSHRCSGTPAQTYRGKASSGPRRGSVTRRLTLSVGGPKRPRGDRERRASPPLRLPAWSAPHARPG
jgi:hypothetical protein